MTIAELRATEAFLDFCAEHDVPLDVARKEIAARILAAELAEMMPDRDAEFFESVCAQFLKEGR